MRFLGFFLLSILSLTALYAQGDDPYLDSLLRVTTSSKQDTTRINAALKWVSFMETQDFDAAFKKATWALERSKKIGYHSGILDAWLALSSMHYENLRGDIMLLYADSVLNYKAYPLKRETQGWALNMQGIGYYIQQRNVDALKSWIKALDFVEEDDAAGLLSNIGNIYLSSGENDDAIEYYLKAIKLNEQSRDFTFLTINHMNVARCYKFTDTLFLHHLNKAISYARLAGYTRMLPEAFGDAVRYYADNNQFEQAANYLDSIVLVGESDPEYAAAIQSSVLARYRFKLASFKQDSSVAELDVRFGNEPVRSLLEMARDVYEDQLNTSEPSDYNNRMHCHKDLAEIYTRLGEFGKAVEHYKGMQQYEDSLDQGKAQFLLKAHEMEMEELEEAARREEQERERMQQRSRLTLALAGSGMLVLVALGLITRLNYVRRSRKAIQKEKDRSEELLLNILPAEIAEELKSKGAADARNYDLVTILFTDFKQFTQTSELLTASELVSELDVCFKAFDRICEKYRIEKIKTIGDSYMAAGGLPVPSEDSVRNTVLAGLEMADFMIKRKLKVEGQGNPTFEMRVGIHTGPVVAGIVGVKKFQYDIWGDTVNTASRMESHGEVGKVNISDTTYSMLQNDPDFVFLAREQVDVKGKGMMQMWFVSQKA
ncbi:MAG: tetratricopeptide repeat protein [Flavobacteriales bacterium]|nr:tetratricopeptide repeat protein [Flavobacteriales bacterium]